MSSAPIERLRAARARRLRSRSPESRVEVDAQAGAGEPPGAPPREDVERLVEAHGPRYQRSYLGRGVHTLAWPRAANHESVWAAVAPDSRADSVAPPYSMSGPTSASSPGKPFRYLSRPCYPEERRLLVVATKGGELLPRPTGPPLIDQTAP